jgi:hypothetical protein
LTNRNLSNILSSLVFLPLIELSFSSWLDYRAHSYSIMEYKHRIGRDDPKKMQKSYKGGDK